ncbi:Imm1 family immunity protein [Allokutzneria sp. A3M-2-11 16]|uniref:Imm1 family immunity protein n=1 Tax=Allokutzneria sp. A3M-2-11 16 TaxID=2962043 RepID=UPI0020B78686|nr:Imm1 family immunity protein [Allokutzneria sp. A3M-2-11 16]MCP3802281.1 Imm1 family immunity protein [Allokutzneria sp. A3M-2-11 16]
MQAWYDHTHGDEGVLLDGAAEVDKLLTTLAAEPGACLVALFRTADLAEFSPPCELLVGVGGGEPIGVMQFSDRDGRWVSQGEPSGFDTLAYYYMGTPTEYPTDAPIPLPRLLAAVHEFAATGDRPAGIVWQATDR